MIAYVIILTGTPMVSGVTLFVTNSNGPSRLLFRSTLTDFKRLMSTFCENEDIDTRNEKQKKTNFITVK